MFPNRAGRPYQPQDISNRAHKRAAGRRPGIARPVRLYDLRHSAAAAWIAAGLPLVFVHAQLGHATIATTMKHYGHLEPTYLRDAAALADQAVFAPIRDMGLDIAGRQERRAVPPNRPGRTDPMSPQHG